MNQDRRMEARREGDLWHPSPCEALEEHANVSSRIMEDLEEIKKLCQEMRDLKDDIASMKEILEVFRSTKGFVTTIKVIGVTCIGVAAFTGAIAGMLAAIKYWANH